MWGFVFLQPSWFLQTWFFHWKVLSSCWFSLVFSYSFLWLKVFEKLCNNHWLIISSAAVADVDQSQLSILSHDLCWPIREEYWNKWPRIAVVDRTLQHWSRMFLKISILSLITLICINLINFINLNRFSLVENLITFSSMFLNLSVCYWCWFFVVNDFAESFVHWKKDIFHLSFVNSIAIVLLFPTWS